MFWTFLPCRGSKADLITLREKLSIQLFDTDIQKSFVHCVYVYTMLISTDKLYYKPNQIYRKI